MRIISLFFFITLISSCSAQSDNTIKIDKSAHMITINLKSNPTTGYQWRFISGTPNGLNLVTQVYLKNIGNLVGSGGITQFKFSYPDTKIKNYSLSFTYERAWESGKGTNKTIEIHL